nr:MBOAT family O-acyltransferase [uncultured Desulfobacter sp.]
MLWKGQKKQKILLAVGIAFNLSILIYFKYTNFFISTCADLTKYFSGSLAWGSTIDVALPIGISFFTFHAISYLIDVYKKKVAPCSNLVDFSMYFMMFPHLIAGPIVRYSEIESSIKQRVINWDLFFSGIVRFCLGLGKKILLADQLASISGKIFSLSNQGELNTPLAWLGIICYTFQIYYDFSGYTDMGIGLAKMFGFSFPENFQQPYRSSNIGTFWRTWHMTLGRWFKDYLYIPLGGNRRSLARTCLNLLIVFFLCGLWHGASYTFIIWGLWYGVLLCIERVLKEKYGILIQGTTGIIASFFLVMMGWVFFSQPTLGAAFLYFDKLFSFDMTAQYYNLSFFLTCDKIVVLCLSIFFAFFNFDFFYSPAKEYTSLLCLKAASAIIVLIFSCAYMALYGFKPFIYFQF